MQRREDTASEALRGIPWRARRKAAVRIFLATLPPVLLAALVFLYGVDVPVQDQWSLIYDMDKSYHHDWTFSDLMRPHNGHRIFIPRVLFVSLAHLTGWNVRTEMGISVGISILTFLILWRSGENLLRSYRRNLPWYLLVLLSVAYFSLNQWENWLWGIQLVVVLSVSAAIAGLYLVSQASLDGRKFAGAMALGIIATFSFGVGLSFWLVGALVLGAVCLDRDRRRDLRFLWTWILLGGSVFLFYFWDLKGGELTSTSYAAEHPLEYLYFVLTAIGTPVVSYCASPWPPRNHGIAFGAGLLGVLLFLFALDLLLRKRRMSPWPMMHFLALALYSLSAAAMTGLVRTSQGVASAMSSRYVTMTTPFWVSCIVFWHLALWPLWRNRQERRLQVTASRIVLAGFAVSIVLSSVYAVSLFVNRHRFLTPARAELRRMHSEELLQRLHPDVRQVHGGIGILQRYRLSVFRDMGELPAPPARPQPLATFGQLISLRSKLKAMSVGERARVRVRVSNPTAETWSAQGNGSTLYSVRLSYHWFDAKGLRVVPNGQRTPLPDDLLPGESVVLEAEIMAPEEPGDHLLRLTMVQESVMWFDDAGAVPTDVWVRIMAK